MIRKHSGLNVSKFALKLGTKTPQTIRALLSGETRTLSDSVKYKILDAFPEINPTWLTTGEGEMLRPVTLSQQNTGGNNTQGLSITTAGGDMYLQTMQKLIDEMAAQRETFAEALRIIADSVRR